MSNFPQRTSYFSINNFLTTHIIQEASIALDIVKQYYDYQELHGYNTRVLSIEGYGEFISFNELCLGLWMVFDRLYWGFPPEVQESVGISSMGWNGPIDNPYVDIPMALEMFDELSANVYDTDEKFLRMQTIEKWFYKPGPNFLNYSSYEVLKTMNEPFYNWIEARLQAIEDALNSVTMITRVSRDYIFDIKPFAKFFDSQYTPIDDDLNLFNKALLDGNRFYLSFLAVLEQILYGFTKKMFPLRIYAIFSYLYKIYMKIIVDFVKPYHAYNLQTAPILRIDGNIDESVTTSDYISRIITKQIVTGVMHRLYDYDDTKDDSLYDVIVKIRDYIKRIIYRSVIDYIRYVPNLDDDDAVVNVFDYSLLVNTQDEIIDEETRVFKEEIYTKAYSGHFPSTWKFYIPTMNTIDKLRQNLEHLTWDHISGTVVNTWNRDVILVGRTKYKILHGVVDVEISALCDPEVRFAFNFDAEQNIIHHHNRHNELLSNCWCYKQNIGWYKKKLPYIYDIGSAQFIDPYPRELRPTDVLDMSEFMTYDDIANITYLPYNVGWIIPVVYIPRGKSFNNVTFNMRIKNMIYPYPTNIPYDPSNISYSPIDIIY